MESGSFSPETVALLILNELRLMRSDMKREIRRLGDKLDHICCSFKDYEPFDVQDVSGSGTPSGNINFDEDDVQEENDVRPASRYNKYNSVSEIPGLPLRPMSIKEEEIPISCTVHVDVSDPPEDEMAENSDYAPSYDDTAEDSNEQEDFMVGDACNEDDVDFQVDAADKSDPDDYKPSKQLSNVQVVETTEGVRFQCDLCSNSYTAVCNLRRHQRQHTGDKRFECTLCTKKFYRKEYLIRHMRKHENIPRKRRVTKAKSLLDFATIVSGNGKKSLVKCKVCNKQFTMLSNLKRHMRIHTGEKPYECKLCNEKFMRDDFVKSHMRKAHPNSNKY